MRLRFIPLTWSGGKWNTSLNEAQVCTLILIGRKMEYLFEWGSGLYPYPDRAENGIPLWMRLRFIPLSWSGGKWNTSLNEAQVYTLNLIGRKMKYLFEWGSGLYPYPDRAENEIPLQRKVYTLIPDRAENGWRLRWWNLRILHNKSDRGFAKGRKMGSLKLEKGLILGVSLLRLNSFWNCLLRENDWWFDLEPKWDCLWWDSGDTGKCANLRAHALKEGKESSP